MKRLRSMLLGGAGYWVSAHLRVMRTFKRAGRLKLARMASARLGRRHGMFISPLAEVPESVVFPHPVGIVIGDGVRIGEGARIYQHVTLGGARVGDWQAGNYPTVGDSAVIFAGAVIVGSVSLGDNCVVGANAVVTKDVPPGATAVGVPARTIEPAANKIEGAE